MADTAYNRVFEVVSDDDGVTWSFWGFLFDAAKHPHILRTSAGALLRAARCDDGCIRAVWQPVGGAVGPIFVLRDSALAPLATEDDSFCIVEDPAMPRRGLLVVRLAGGTQVALMQSTDEFATWSLRATMFTGGEAPTIAVSPNGMILFAARVGQIIKGRMMYPGDAGPQGEYVFSSGATLVTVHDDGQFGIAVAQEDPRRFLLAVGLEEPTGTFISTDWASPDDGGSFQRLT